MKVTILNKSLLIFIIMIACPALTFCEETSVPSLNLTNRQNIIENELQAAAEEARIQAQEQTQENYLRIQRDIHDNIKDVNMIYDRLHPNPEDKKTENNVNELYNYDVTQEKLQKFQKDVGQHLKRVSDHVHKAMGSFDFEKDAEHYQDSRLRLKKIEAALQLAQLYYRTDADYHGDNIRKNAGFVGLSFSYTYRRPYKVPIHNILDFWRLSDGPGALFTFARFEADFSSGQSSYQSALIGKRTEFNAWKYNVRGLMGYDLLSEDLSLIVTPYSGIGYRSLNDKTGGFLAYYPDSYVPYRNSYNFVYIPLGIETLKHVNKDMDISFRLEGSIVIIGWDKFYIKDVPGEFTAEDVDTGIPFTARLQDSSVDLKGGFGFKTSSKFIRLFDVYNLFAEPYFEFWRLNKSKSEKIHHYNIDNGTDYVTITNPLYEPRNYTIEYGIKFGVQF